MELELKLESELNAMVAITVVVISVFLGIIKLKDENIIQAMQHSQVQAVDLWNQYQAERIKLHGDENDAAALTLRAGFGGADPAAVSAEAKRLDTRIAHYQTEFRRPLEAGEGRRSAVPVARIPPRPIRHGRCTMFDRACTGGGGRAGEPPRPALRRLGRGRIRTGDGDRGACGVECAPRVVGGFAGVNRAPHTKRKGRDCSRPFAMR